MKQRSRVFLPALVASLAAFACASCTRRDETAQVAKAIDAVGQEVWAYVAIPSLEQALKDVSAVAERFAPGKVTVESLKAQLGGMLQDPQLANLELRKPILVLALQAPQPGGLPLPAAVLAVKQASPYEQALAGLGMKTRFAGGLLYIAQTPEGLEAAARAQGLYDQIRGSGLEASARFYLHVAKLLEAFGPLLEAQLDGLLGKVAANVAAASTAGGGPGTGPESMRKLLNLEVQALLALLRQVEATQVDLDLGSRTIGVDQVVTARSGSALAAGFTSSAARPSPSAGFIQEGGLMAGTLGCEPKGFAPLFRQLAEELSRSSAGFLPREALAFWTEMGSWWGGTGAFSLRSAKEGIVIEYVLDVTDEAKALEVVEKAQALFAPGSGFGDFYQQLGIGFDMKVEKAVRQYQTVSIHRLKVSLLPPEKDGGGAPAPPLESLKAWLKDVEIAFVKGHGLYANEPANLDRMIDRVLSSGAREVTLEARKAFGPGGHGYLDYDVIGVLKTFLSAIPEGQPRSEMMAAFAKVTAKAPMVFALVFGDARARFQAQVPLEPFAQMATADR